MNFNIKVLLNCIRSKAKNILTVTYFDEKKHIILGSNIKIKINALQHIYYTVTVRIKYKKSDSYGPL